MVLREELLILLSTLQRDLVSTALKMPKKGNKYPAESTGAVLGAFLPISSALPVSAAYEVAFPCIRCMDGTKGEPGRVPGAELRLGCTPRYVDGRVFATKVLPESQAEVDEVVLAGDILDEISGCSLRSACPGQVRGDRGDRGPGCSLAAPGSPLLLPAPRLGLCCRG